MGHETWSTNCNRFENADTPDPITQSLYWCLVCLVLSTTYFVIMWGGKKGTSADHGLLL